MLIKIKDILYLYYFKLICFRANILLGKGKLGYAGPGDMRDHIRIMKIISLIYI